MRFIKHQKITVKNCDAIDPHYAPSLNSCSINCSLINCYLIKFWVTSGICLVESIKMTAKNFSLLTFSLLTTLWSTLYFHQLSHDFLSSRCKRRIFGNLKFVTDLGLLGGAVFENCISFFHIVKISRYTVNTQYA